MESSKSAEGPKASRPIRADGSSSASEYKLMLALRARTAPPDALASGPISSPAPPGLGIGVAPENEPATESSKSSALPSCAGSSRPPKPLGSGMVIEEVEAAEDSTPINPPAQEPCNNRPAHESSKSAAGPGIEGMKPAASKQPNGKAEDVGKGTKAGSVHHGAPAKCADTAGGGGIRGCVAAVDEEAPSKVAE
eukprot:CAMPEP_0177374326 /NCGR_PEP_ID=MMETSP0368-20130122/44100_1 /TAXON_ID=447022 ORGANISM="Scrippsiella hangoei-like, Strain SHHI-4" /NCGR_SAMPLE_ID=MMETSP0368 /ASSEMBLY_ACC=CAM_ASM_000363 /LENGTH=193 /DNA_ID=CAMNT_0018837919 /DNA_START=14 /DNA_END=594 /DNA_ORIENTATION=-